MAKYLISEDGKSITCFKCGRTSHHPHDVKEKFCGYCSVFHGEERWVDCNVVPDKKKVLEWFEKIKQLLKEI